MNKLLDQAIAEVSRLPDDAQEAIASAMLEQAAAERAWAARFEATQDKLAALAARARQRIAQGEVLPYDPSDAPRE
ncbi:hypothetical protein [Rhodocista pekingensis]|uniref:Uncharacterized protein n=1 Tax=Rhodocista pekingensis TaxID=201185 RepID=A0ABW2KWR7_9PROT